MGFCDHRAPWLIDVAIAATRRARMRARRKGVCGRSTKMIERWRMPLASLARRSEAEPVSRSPERSQRETSLRGAFKMGR
jgi:hypothetical protein